MRTTLILDEAVATKPQTQARRRDAARTDAAQSLTPPLAATR